MELSKITLIILFTSFLQFSAHAKIKPNGELVNEKDPLLNLDALNTWAHHLDETSASKDMIFAGIGKPTYMLNKDIALAATAYWQEHFNTVSQTEQLLFTNKETSKEKQCDTIVQASSAIDYGNSAGEYQSRCVMAQALSTWYGTDLSPEDLIFTVGGISALNMVFTVFNEELQQGRIVTTTPYYPYYYRPHLQSNMHTIDCMQEPGYRLTAAALKKSIEQANDSALVDGKKISAFLFCDPNNPLGTVVGKDEWKKIADVLKTTSDDIPIIIDEAYAEMVFGPENHVSLLSIAPELKSRIIVLRSATKAFSASGERMAVIVCNNQTWREMLLDQILISYCHAPKSLQYAYAQAMLNFTEEKRAELAEHYNIQSEYAQKRLKAMEAQLPDPLYAPEGTFYVIADLSALFRAKLSKEAMQALGKNNNTIETDEDICYSLLFDDHVMITPLSYFGLDPQKGFVRITCSGGITKLNELMNRIENRLEELSPKKGRNSPLR